MTNSIPETGLTFLGLVNDKGVLKAEFGPFGLHKNGQPPSTLLLTYDDIPDTTVAEREFYTDDPEEEKVRINRQVLEEAKRHLQTGRYFLDAAEPDLSLTDFPFPIQTPQDMLDVFDAYTQHYRGNIEQALEELKAALANDTPADEINDEHLRTLVISIRYHNTETLTVRDLPEIFTPPEQPLGREFDPVIDDPHGLAPEPEEDFDDGDFDDENEPRL